MTRRFLLAAALAVAVPGAAWAQVAPSDPLASGAAFLRTCEDPAGRTATAACQVYVRGLHDQGMLLSATGGLSEGAACPPTKSFSYDQVRRDMIGFLHSHPQYAEPGSAYETASIYWMAMAAKYPCRSASPERLPPSDKWF